MKNKPIFIIILVQVWSFAATIIPQDTTVCGIWKKELSPYIISGKIVIPEDSVLLIEPGVEVKFKASENYGTGIVKGDFYFPAPNVGYMVVHGKLLAIGNKEDSITFTRNDTAGHWGIIVFTEKSDSMSLIKYCTINYSFCIAAAIGDPIPDSLKSILGYGAISFNNASATIDSCTFTYTKREGINCRGNSRPTIVHNFFSSNGYYSIDCFISSEPLIGSNIFHKSGISCFKSSPIIKNNTISGAKNSIYCTDSSSPIITDNILTGNVNAIEIGGASPVISNNVIMNNQKGMSIYGGPNTLIENNTIQNNICGIECSSNSTITGNNITGNQDGIRCYYSDYIVNNIISNNSGNGIICSGPPSVSIPNIVSNVIANNGLDGIYCGGVSPDITNNTIVNNSGTGIVCYSNEMHPESFSSPVINNSIIWGNITSMTLINDGNKPQIAYSLVQGTELPSDVSVANTVIFNEDPQFVDEFNNDYKLKNESPCVNKGKVDTTGLGIPQFDVAGDTRIVGTIDIGAYENQIISGVKHYTQSTKNSIEIANYPNPFKTKTIFFFSKPANQKATLGIYSLRGKLIKSVTLYNDQMVEWIPKKLNAGIYVYILSTDNCRKVNILEYIK